MSRQCCEHTGEKLPDRNTCGLLCQVFPWCLLRDLPEEDEQHSPPTPYAS